MGRSTIHYTDNATNNILKQLHKQLRPAGTPVQRVEYIIELLLLRIFEIKLRQDTDFLPLRKLFEKDNEKYLFSYLFRLTGEQVKTHLNKEIFPFYAQILSKSKKVFKENLPQKVQDNLVLIEEVFSNSSFTTNVQSGNMSNIIGLIQDIDEITILKTDILGDAIESALSETGGTQDIGLYRTPEHIRQMMVAIVDPNFTDTIYDPACGTGGFLFDAYHYCLEKVAQDSRWPSPKFPPSHPELNEYFKNYFKRFKSKMPDMNTVSKFYREGVSGIEYLGMIRKMAAINLYIRGLNPANIIQGDSLAHFKSEIDSNSKSIILSNPPFGAERDQPAYPNVWQEYSKESETTILFVKLMFDMLKKGGRCAVIVSEGFLTWDKTSARTMRKILLEEANLKAIISLPQGVFVSKQGQGAKTSVLYFEKGVPTDWIWYYKIENDGFSMGVNRKPISGCQIPEVIETFHNYVKNNRIPPETKNSFVVPSEWIKTLDPRLKERIKNTTKGKIIIKRNEERQKLITQLNVKKKKGNLSEKEYQEKIKQFDLITESKFQNEVSKEIEKAHLYSFNLKIYKSDLSDEQIEEWKKIFIGIEPENNSKIDVKYEKLKTANTDLTLKILAGLNPKNSLEMSIAEEVLNKLSDDNDKIKKLKEILSKRQRWPSEKLEKLLIPKYEKIKKEDYAGDYDIVEKIEFSKGEICFREEKNTGMDLYKAEAGDLITSKINLYQGAIALVPKELVCSTHYQVYKININLIEPKYLFYILRSRLFVQLIAEYRNKGIKNEQGAEFLLNYSIPLPPLKVQQQIIEKIERQRAIIEGAEKILNAWEVSFSIFENFPKKYIFEFADLNPITETKCLKDQILVNFISMNAVDDLLGKIRNAETKNFIEVKTGYTCFQNGDILWAKITPCMENGKCFIAENLINGIGFGSTEFHVIRVDKNKAVPKFIFYILRTKYVRNLAAQVMTGTSGHKRVPESFLKEFQFPLPSLEIQQKIVEELDKEMEALEKVKYLKEKAEKKIEEILEEIWGDKASV